MEKRRNKAKEISDEIRKIVEDERVATLVHAGLVLAADRVEEGAARAEGRMRVDSWVYAWGAWRDEDGEIKMRAVTERTDRKKTTVQ